MLLSPNCLCLQEVVLLWLVTGCAHISTDCLALPQGPQVAVPLSPLSVPSAFRLCPVQLQIRTQCPTHKAPCQPTHMLAFRPPGWKQLPPIMGCGLSADCRGDSPPGCSPALAGRGEVGKIEAEASASAQPLPGAPHGQSG